VAIPTWSSGQVLTAADVDSWFVPLVAYKTADEAVTSSTTLQNDDDLFVSVAASATYQLIAYFIYDGGTTGSSDLKIGWTFPSGLTMAYGHIGMTTSATITEASVATSSDQTNNPQFGSDGAGQNRAAYLLGTVFVSTTAGTLQLQWAQGTSSGTATHMKKGSWLQLQRVG